MKETRTCATCSIERPLSDFYRTRSRNGQTYYRRTCRFCAIQTVRQWQKDNPEKVRENLRRSYRRNRQAHLERNRLRLGRATPEQVAEWIGKHGDRCGICGRMAAESQRGRANLHADHDHETGRFRGLLCHRCNTALGLLGDDASLMRRAAEWVAA